MPRRSPASPSEDSLVRESITASGQRLWRGGLIAATEGNLSVRLDAERLLITPTARRKWELRPDELLVVRADAGAPNEGASSDVRIHRAIYAARPDVTAVAHAHLPASMGLTLAGEIPDPAALPETALFLGRLPFLSFGEPGSADLAGRVAAALAEGDERLPVAVLLERHGAVAVGTVAGAAAVGQAVDRLELVEVLCRTWRDALVVRAARAALASSGDAEPTIL
jgi:L-fuculose-phosphate aldolase